VTWLPLAAACGTEPTADSAAAPPQDGGVDTIVPGVTVPSSVAVATATAPSTADPALVAACVEWVKFQAFVGDPEGVALWDEAGGTDPGLGVRCTVLAERDEDRARDMRDEIGELQAMAQAAQEASAASTTLAPGCHPSYGDCLPIVTDVDCEGNGDGPVFIALSVIVFGDDEYELDRDGDGLACEPGDR
jgi:hypothetical protein